MHSRTTLSWRLTVLAALTAVLTTGCEVQRNPGTGVDNPVAQVIVSPDTLTLDPFEAHQFRVFGRTQAGDSVPVSVGWSASAGPITSGGMYTADTSAADVTVTASLSSPSVSGSSRVRKRRLIQIVIDPKNTTLPAGGARQFTVYGRKNTGDSVSVAVTYAATGGTISAGGAFTAGQTPGTYSVIARQNGGSLADTSAVTVVMVPVASVSVNPATASVAVGQTAQLTATPRDGSGYPLSGRAVTWATSNAAVATVNGSGLVTGATAGSATITATSEGQSGTAAITVTVVPVASVTVSPATATVLVGQTVQLTATPRDGSGNPLSGRVVTWATSNAAVATVNPNGLVTGAAAGSATITATSEGKSGSAAITVTVVPVASVTVAPATASVTVGQTVQLTATAKDGSGNPLSGRVVTWATSNGAVATVSSSGLVSGVAAGTATITATSEGQSGTASVTVTTTATSPGTVTNLTVASVTTNSATLSFTEVTDGTGQPASYVIRWAVGTLSWASATDVAQGSCTVPVAGTAIGAARSCTVLGLQAGTSYQFRLVAFRGTLNVDAVFGALSNVASGTTTSSSAPVATVTVSPASASVVVGAVQQFTATLKDASGNVLTGRPVTWASSDLVVATVSGTGLASGLVVGTATLTATSEGQSGSAALTVTVAPPGGVVFQSDWSTGIGTAFNLVTDGGRWMNYWEFNNGTSVQLLSVVAGGPGGRNALKVLQRGSTYAANVQQDNVVPPSTDYYVRFYMRNDDNSSAGDHIVTVDTYEYANLTFMRKYGGGSGWQFVASLYGCGYTYPIGHWGPSLTLSNGAWYRFEYFVDFVDATHVQVHARVYDASGTQILGDADIRQSDFGTATWNGRSDWTWASYYAAGHSFCVNPAPMTSFGLGNNGQQGAADTGLPWYFAAVQIRTDRWPGP